ncbi:MAG: holo-ACP synthase [Alphaproteobacteria bacterium]|nr:holo-ACP synthase [Alphaproteobacteria bacterium]
MILGLGCDIVNISRFDKDIKFLSRFSKKYLTDIERLELARKIKSDDSKALQMALATRFAAKEAVSKALGSGFRHGITLKDIEIVHDNLGKPLINLYNKALARAYLVSDNQDFKMHITLSNEREYVNAVVVMEAL